MCIVQCTIATEFLSCSARVREGSGSPRGGVFNPLVALRFKWTKDLPWRAAIAACPPLWRAVRSRERQANTQYQFRRQRL